MLQVMPVLLMCSVSKQSKNKPECTTQSITLFADSCPEILVAAKQATLAPLLFSLPVQKQLDPKKSIWKHNMVFLVPPQQSLVFIFLIFIGIFSEILMWCTVADPCCLITTQKLSRHHFPYNQQNTWLCLLNHSVFFYNPAFCLWFLI